MQLRDWRKSSDLTLQACADRMGLAGGGRTFQRLERGEVNFDADTVAKIAILTAGAVTAQDMHETRLAWLRDNRPDKFPDDAGGSLVEAAGSLEPPPFAEPAATGSNDAAAPSACVQAGAAASPPAAAPAELPEAAE